MTEADTSTALFGEIQQLALHLNDQYKFPLRFNKEKLPENVAKEERHSWHSINRKLQTMLKSEKDLDRYRLLSVLQIFEGTAEEYLKARAWIDKPQQEPDLLGPRRQLIEQLERAIGTSAQSTPYSRKRSRRSDAEVISNLDSGNVRYPDILIPSPDTRHVPESTARHECRSYPSPSTSSEHSGRKKARRSGSFTETQTTTRRRDDGSISRDDGSISKVSRDTIAFSYRPGPGIKPSDVSISSSRHTSFNTARSITSMPATIETPATSFGSNPRPGGTMQPPSRPDSSKTHGSGQAKIPSVVPANDNHTHQHHHLPSRDEYGFSASLEDVLQHVDLPPVAPAVLSSLASTTAETEFAPSQGDTKGLFSSHNSPFRQADFSPGLGADFLTVYQVARIAIEHKTKPSKLLRTINSTDIRDYEKFENTMMAMSSEYGKTLRESPIGSCQAEAKAANTMILGGKLSLDLKSLTLFPVRIDGRSHRFARKFGADRYFVLRIPRMSEADKEGLVNTEHRFLGRRWHAFYAKPSDDADKKYRHTVYFFATSGFDLTDIRACIAEGYHRDRRCTNSCILRYVNPKTHVKVRTGEMVNWHLNWKANSDQSYAKLFSRISLGLTRTIPAFVFKQSQLVYTSDAYSCCAGKRSLAVNALTRLQHKHPSDANVMNDGCGRISRAALQEIARLANRWPPPCAVQGRIAGAKGVWIVDPSLEIHNGDDVWIEITESQLKYSARLDDPLCCTFEIHSWAYSSPAGSLKFIQIPLLEHGGVPSHVFQDLLEADITRIVTELQDVMDKGGPAFTRWVETNLALERQTDMAGEIKMSGGFPDSLAWRLVLLSESGHHPKRDAIMTKLCSYALLDTLRCAKGKGEIGLPKSRTVLIVPDPLAVLEEDEIFYQSSRSLQGPDGDSSGQTTYLNLTDVILTRFPANMAPDIQKLKAVYQPELSVYVDVIVFSTKGKRSVADILSGGDFDGDKVWISWEPTLVEPFRNSEFVETPKREEYGISKNTETVAEVRAQSSRLLVQKGLKLSLQDNMLAICTDWYNSWLYHEHKRYKLGHKQVLFMGGLLSHLVDSAKNGYNFSEGDFRSLKQRLGFNKYYSRPAWSDQAATQSTACAEITMDHLRFWILPMHINKAVEAHRQLQQEVGSYDGDLSLIYHGEAKHAKNTGFTAQLNYVDDYLKASFRKLENEWERWTSRSKQPGPPKWVKEAAVGASDDKCFRQIANWFREQFLAIEPPDMSDFQLVDRWRAAMHVLSCNEHGCSHRDHILDSTPNSWTLFKASTLNFHYQQKYYFTYTVAGKELCEIKAIVRNPITDLYVMQGSDRAYLKTDRRRVANIEAGMLKNDVVEAEGINDDEDFGYCIDDE